MILILRTDRRVKIDMIKLPCTNCGNNLSIVKGATVQCFACGTKNAHYESHDLLSSYVQEIFGYTKLIDNIEDSKKINENDILFRTKKVNDAFNTYLTQKNKLKYIVVSKINSKILDDSLALSVEVSRNFGMLGILISSYILPHLKSNSMKNQYTEYLCTCEIYQLVILGLRSSIEAKENFQIEISSELYERARWNFQKAVEIIDEYQSRNNYLNFEKERILFSVASDFCRILKNILTDNPTIYSDDFEDLFNKIDDLFSPDARMLNAEMQKIYELANELPKILEEIRVKAPLTNIDTHREKILYHSEEIEEELSNGKIWLNDIEDRYKSVQKEIIKLHSGNFHKYLENFRKEFKNRHSDGIKLFNNIIEEIINTSLLDFTLLITDYLEEMESVITIYPLKPSEIVNRIRIIKKDIIRTDDDLKNFLFEITDFGIEKDLKAEHTLNIVTSISDKHSSFDRLIYQYLKKLINNFITERDEKRFTLEEQREKFNFQINPIIENLVKESFTLKKEDIPYPMFLEVLMLSTQMVVEKEYKIFFVIENPSEQDIRNVNVTFFIPNSFRIKTRFYKIKKIKPNQRINVETRIIPSEPGFYHFMAMAEYEYSKELYWMPSLQFKLKVLNEEQASEKLDDDKVLNEIYKKYGKVVNIEEYIEDEDEEFIEELRAKKIKDDELLPDTKE